MAIKLTLLLVLQIVETFSQLVFTLFCPVTRVKKSNNSSYHDRDYYFKASSVYTLFFLHLWLFTQKRREFQTPRIYLSEKFCVSERRPAGDGIELMDGGFEKKVGGAYDN